MGRHVAQRVFDKSADLGITATQRQHDGITTQTIAAALLKPVLTGLQFNATALCSALDAHQPVSGGLYRWKAGVETLQLGIAYQLRTTSQQFTLNEPELMSGHWVAIPELSAYRDRMETWSQILFDHHILLR